MAEEVLVERQDGVATVTFNRPDQRNAISYDNWRQLNRIADELERDDDVKVVVLTGAGEKAFSAGADIKDFELYRNDSESAKSYAAAFDGAMDAVEALSKPTISMIKRLLRRRRMRAHHGDRHPRRRRQQPVCHSGGTAGESWWVIERCGGWSTWWGRVTRPTSC